MKKNLLMFLTIIVSIHCLLTICYNLPTNPFSKKHENIIHSYMNPLFSQTWTLFAPNPVSSNNNLQVQFYTAENKSKWFDISSYYQKYSRKYYLHPYTYKNSILTQLESDIISDIDKVNKKKKGNSENKKFYDENIRVKKLYNFINEELEDQGIKPDKIQLKYETEVFPSYASKEKTLYIARKLPQIKKGDIKNE